MDKNTQTKIDNANKEFADGADKIKVRIDYGNPIKDGMVTGLAVVGAAVVTGATIYGVMALVNGPVIEDISFNNSPNNFI